MRNRKRGAAGTSVADAHIIDRFAETPGVWISITGAAFYGLYYERLKPIGLKPSLVTALAIIEQFEGITQSELGRKLKINRASAMSVANTLVDLGLIEKSQLARLNQNALSISAEGSARLEQACDIEKEISDQALGELSEEERLLFIRNLKNIAQKIGEIGST